MANINLKKLLTRTDADGHVTMLLQTTLDHRKDEIVCALKDKHAHLNSQRKLRKSAQG